MSNGKKLTKRRIKKKNNDCFWMENIFCLESHIHLCSCHTSAIPAYVIKTCVTWHAISGTRYWGFVSPKLHVSTYRNQQHCWWFHNNNNMIIICISRHIHVYCTDWQSINSPNWTFQNNNFISRPPESTILLSHNATVKPEVFLSMDLIRS